MTCASVTIRLRGLMYVNLANQSVTYVSGTFVTLDSGLNTLCQRGKESPPSAGITSFSLLTFHFF